ncbi:tRNA pseudouridine(13) synthase TruD [Candidatus Woesearchaeota archaeon]|nr:tRNA pseudouridine(13) synthase TruD [Candidatus Woesearchaeota archaeon]
MFSSDGMVLLKTCPEDFIVEELIDVPKGSGQFHYYWLHKRNMTTLAALKIISRKTGVSLSKIGYAGNKDKVALTTQLISMPKRISDFSERSLSVVYAGQGDDRITLGDNRGNHFVIVVRGIIKRPSHREEFINFFGKQRFGGSNAAIGHALVRGDFREAARLASEQGSTTVREHLAHHPSDVIGALRTIPRRLLMLFVHAFQSLLWNESVRRHIAAGSRPQTVPLVGFGTEDIDEITQHVLNEFNVAPRDFIIRSLPGMSSEGTTRTVFARCENLVLGQLVTDEVSEKMKMEISFDLGPGSYATVFVEQLFADAQ